MTKALDGAPVLLLKDRALTFCGNSYMLRFSMVGMIALKEHWQVDDDEPVLARIRKKRVTDIPAQLWACLQTHHREITYDQVVKMTDDSEPDDLAQAYRVTQEALAAGWGNPKKKDAATEAPPAK